MITDSDKYEMAGGDAAWRAWIDICSVAGVRDRDSDLAKGLSQQISSEMAMTLARSGYAFKDFESDDSVSLPSHHQLLEFTQTHIHRVGDAIQPSHPLSSPSPPASNPSQRQSLFQ